VNPFDTYIRDLRAIRSSGAAVKETSYYPALANLLNEVGKTLKPPSAASSISRIRERASPTAASSPPINSHPTARRSRLIRRTPPAA
jgi:hypothetical protein